MKKLLIFASAAIATLFAGACQREEGSSAAEEVSVNLSLQVPSELQTKAMSQAELTDVVYYEIWNSDFSKKLYPLEGQTPAYVAVSNCKANLDITLVSAQTYNFIFWAQNQNCGAYDVTDLKSVKVDYSVIAAGNQDKFDAFYAVKKIAITGPINEAVTLYRPFAQLNFGADAMTTIFGNVNVGLSSVKLSSLATQFNTVSGMGEGEIKDVVFNADGIVTNEALEVNGKSYTWVSMNYVLMQAQQSVAQVNAEFNLGMDVPVKHSISSVPLKKNYRTNIVGNLFTADAELSIVVEPTFAQPDETVIM